MATTSNNDMRFLRTIPEDRSDVASSLALHAGRSAGVANSSVRGLDAGREGSENNTNIAELPDQPAVPRGFPHRRPGGTSPRIKISSSFVCVLLSTLIVVAGAIVAIVVVTVSDKNVASSAGTASPTPSPTVDPETVAALDAVLFTLDTMQGLQFEGSKGLADGVNVDENDPRVRARHWMLHEDLLRDEYLNAEYAPAILQRYCLAEFYYATNGKSWSPFVEEIREQDNVTTTRFLTPEAPECDWEGITCVQDEESNYHLRKIVLADRNLTGTLPASFYVLPELGEVNLTLNSIHGPLPDEWFDREKKGLPQLFVLDLEANQLTGTIPPTLWSQPVMRFVYLNRNQLTGPVFGDEYDGQVSIYLEDVWLQNNALTGPLPTWLFSHYLLTTFWADNNKFTGPLPKPPLNVYETSPLLTWLTLRNNSLSGRLQNNHFVGQSLQTLHLNDNQFTGPLPSTDAEIKVPLMDVWLHNNQFTGNLPVDFGLTWTQLQDLRLTGNPDLTGTITADQCRVFQANFKNDQRRLEVDCPAFECACCTNDECK